MSTIDKIDNAAELTGIDLTAASAKHAEQSSKTTAYRALSTTREDVMRAVHALVNTPAHDIPTAWETVVHTYAQHLAWDELQDAMFHTLNRSQTAAESAAPWKALALLTAHIEKAGKEIVKLATHNIDTAEQAIAAGHVKEYERFTTLVQELEELANLPELNKRAWTDRSLVIIQPPAIVQYDPEPDEPFTASETRLHNQAFAHYQATSITARILHAARNRWTITPATTTGEYTDRLQQITNGTRWSDGAFSRDRSN